MRSDGGYVVVAPSIHPNERAYEWELLHHPDKTPLAELPPPWIERLRSLRTNTQAVSTKNAPIVEGERNDTLPKEEVDKIASSTSRYEPSQQGTRPESTEDVEPTQPPPEPWPTLAEAALHGLVGDIVRTIGPYSEADPVAVLLNLLTMLGNVINANAHFLVEHTLHFLRLFVTLVGKTAKGRKGQSLSTPRHIFQQIDPEWVKGCITGGLSSGEGLIYQVRDPRYGMKEGKEILLDEGVEDKRLLLVEEEFAGVLKVAGREGNSLSAVIRQAWDKGELRPLTKNNPIRATGAHISILAHITNEELLRHLNETEQTNGFANRFLWILVKRSKVIPRPVGVPAEQLSPLVERLQKAVDCARKTTVMDRDKEAETLWERVYPELSEGKPGLFGGIIARAEVQVMRLACLYALLDCSSLAGKSHLEAALAVWEYAEESARLIFGDALGDPIADEIDVTLRQHPEGLTRTDISHVFGRNRKAGEITRALNVLLKAGKARRKEGKDTGGRPSERWYAITKKTKETK